MKKKVIIFGAGRWGRAAYYYYKNDVEILCFVDNNKELWETILENIPIHSPEILKTMNLTKITIIIAIKNNWKEIQKQLLNDYKISGFILFTIEEEFLDRIELESEFDYTKHEIIISYMGGLGNQMFQYALARCFMSLGSQVSGDVSSYILGERKFELPLIFPNVLFKECDRTMRIFYDKVINRQYKEQMNKKDDYIHILETKEGILKGFWQTFKFAEIIKNELLYEFTFQKKNDKKLKEIIKCINGQNTASVHIRRGDYLQETGLYGNICTDEYYKRALDYIEEQTENIIFYFFSDDIDWVKKKYKKLDNAVFIQKDLFEEYEDWYDMCLMSCCKHNIIANSTFSWWGAWLNKNPNKIVIAPQKWMNDTEMKNICPEDWIRL